jgi:hypothetical protein
MPKFTAPKSAELPSDFEAPGLPGEARIDSASIPPAYWRAFSLVAFTMNRFIVDHVVRSARLFDNDTEAMILFGMLSHLNAAHLMPPGASPSQLLNAQGRVPDPQPRLRPVRIRDLTLITGRPRETIRRKLERLEAEGRVLRVVGGYVLNVESVDPTMRALSVDGVRRFMQAARVIDSALKDADRALANEVDSTPHPAASP